MARLRGTSGRDRLTGTATNDVLLGLGEKDTLIGLAGNDVLDGGAGADRALGGPGNDIYRVDQGNDRVIELAGEGRDRVMSTVSFILPENVENLVLLGAVAINGTGNELGNRIIGNAARNILSGRAGNDRLEGRDGNDVLDGGLGVDTLIGGLGNDLYRVDRAGERTIELANEGIDIVQASVSYVLGDNVERLSLTGTGNLRGTGNGLANTIIGNAGNNLLTGGGGADRLLGMAGNDVLAVADNGFVRADGGIGGDTLRLGASGTIDLTALIGRLVSIETIDLAGTAGGTMLQVAATEVLRLSEATDTLIVRGGVDDTVAFDAADQFRVSGTQTIGGITFNRFGSGTTTVLVQQGIAITGDNASPVAIDDIEATTENAAVAIAVLANDSDIDAGDTRTVTAVDDVDVGASVVDNGDGTITYNPGNAFDFLRAGATASDNFTYTIADAAGATASATVTVTVTGVNDAPTAADDAAMTTENAPVTVAVLANDSDVDAGDTRMVTAVSGIRMGASAVVNGDGTITYDPGTVFDSLRVGQTASDTFTYTMSDGPGATSAATVTVVVTGQNDAPVAIDDTEATAENAAVTIDVLASDSDIDDGNALMVTAVSGVTMGASAVINGDGTITYDPGTAFDSLRVGETPRDTFTYTIADAAGATASATVTIAVTGQNDAPVALDDGMLTTENAAVTIDVLTNDTDVDAGDTRMVTSVSGVNMGASAVVNGDGTITYDAGTTFDSLRAGEIACDTFTYTVADGAGATSAATVTITVTGQNDAPVAIDDIEATTENAAVTIDVLANDSDVDAGDTRMVTAVSGVNMGASAVVNGDGTITYNPGDAFDFLRAGETAANTITYTIADATGATASATVTVTVSGDLPGDLGALDLNDGFRLDGAAAGDYTGFAVSSAGDVNGDGFDDIIIGAVRADPNGLDQAGSTYLVFGRTSGFGSAFDLSSLDGTNGFRLDGGAIDDLSGTGVSTAGDLNGDGLADIIVGAPLADPNGAISGSSYVVFGRTSGFAAATDLSSLDGTSGFRLDGAAAGDFSGRTVSAGDVNGDGFDDLIIGAVGADPGARDFAGSSYVVFGGASGFASTMNLSSLDGTNGFRLDGVAAADASGRAVSAAGDVNGDGIVDILVGANGTDANGSYSGSGYVVFGRASGFTSVMNLASLDGTTGFRLDGAAADDRIGYAVSAAGDVNGDGISDILFGASLADPSGRSVAGSSFVVFGRTSGFASTMSLSSLDGSNGFRLDGAAAGERSGYSVSSAGDVNGDGIDDLIVGAMGASLNGSSSGSSYVVFGQATGFASAIALSSLDPTTGFRLDGAAAYDRSGYAVSAAGDINGDGFADLIIGANRAAPNGLIDAGSGHVVFGGNFTGAVSRLGGNGDDTLVASRGAGADGLVGGRGNDALVGDGGLDVLIGGQGDDTLTVADLAFRRVDGGTGSDMLRILQGGTVNLSAIDGPRLQSIEAIDLACVAGGTTLEIGRLDVVNLSESTNELLVRGGAGDTVRFDLADAFAMTGSEVRDGVTFAVFGSGAATVLVEAGVMVQNVPVFALAGLNGDNGFRLDGEAEADLSGISVAAAGDVNGDGFGDVIVGAFRADAGSETDAGATYVVFGGAGRSAVSSLSLSALDGSNGFRLTGGKNYDSAGVGVSGIGDFNGDGIVDFIVGAYADEPPANGLDGASYVVFGTASGFAPSMSLSLIDGTNGLRIDGEAPLDYSGITVARAGDVNGDGLADVIIGSRDGADDGTLFAGKAHVVFGRSDGISTLSLSTLDGANGFRLFGANGYDFASRVAGAGDVNGDGFDDVIVGAIGTSYNAGADDYSGAAFVVFGGASGLASDLSLSSIDGVNGFRLDGGSAYDFAGRSVASAGDFNGDGIEDLIVGAYFADPAGEGSYAGAAYVVFGTTSGFASAMSLATLDGTNGFRLDGAGAIDYTGISVSTAGDINGDGFDDILVGASNASPGSPYAGSTYVVFGRASGIGSALSLSSLDGSDGFRLDGVAADDGSGRAVSAAGDLDGDGFADLVIGARAADPAGESSGASYVFFGGNFNAAVDVLGGDGDDMLAASKGAALGDVLVGGRGDDTLAGDGGLDVLIGGQGNDDLAVADLGFRRVDGGTGFDELLFQQAGMIDLAAVRGRIHGVDLLDVSNGAANTVNLRLADVLTLDAQNIDARGTTLDNVLVVDAGDGENDTVNLSTADGWMEQSSVMVEGEKFRVFTAASTTIAIDDAAQIVFA